MSVKLYVHRCEPEDLWDVHETMRRWALEHSDGAQDLIRAIAEDYLDREADPEAFDHTDTRSYKMYEKWSKASDTDYNNEDVRIQVFYEPEGTLLLRFLITMHQTRVLDRIFDDIGERLPLEEVYAQNSTDMTDEDHRNMPIAAWLDGQINAKRYSTIPVMDSTDAWHMLFDHRDPEESERLADAICVAREQRENPEPLSPRVARQIAFMMSRSPREYVSRLQRAFDKLSDDDQSNIEDLLEPVQSQAERAGELLEVDWIELEQSPTEQDLSDANMLMSPARELATALEQLAASCADRSKALQQVDQVRAQVMTD